jgi:polar amino acid transport system ATP-binding protein
MTRSDIAVSFSGACKAFGDKEVLHGVDFEIGRGEVVSLIGPSGAGKSTMLRCLTLLETLDAGRIAYGDAVVCEGAEKAVYSKAAMREARMRFGLVFQDYNLFPHRTVLQNVMDAPLIVRHRKEDEVRKEAEELLERLRPRRQGRCRAVRAFGRPAAARCHCPRPLHEPRGHVLR